MNNLDTNILARFSIAALTISAAFFAAYLGGVELGTIIAQFLSNGVSL